MKKYWIYLFLFLLVFFGWMSVTMYPLTTDWDSSRHEVASFIYMTWIKDGFSDWSAFTQQINAKLVDHASWFLTIDPPFYSLIQAFIFLIFGVGFVSARITTALLICLGAPFLFLLSRKLLKSDLKALFVVILFLLSPTSIELSAVSILEIPIAFAMVCWYYFTFEREKKSINLKYGEKTFSFCPNYIIGALFLSITFLMKYQHMVFYAVFMIAYFCFFCLTKRKSDALSLIKIGMVQSIVFFILTGWWIHYLFSSGIWERVIYEGAGRAREWTINYFSFFFRDMFPQTGFLAVFAIVPFLLKEGRLWIKENARIVIFILSVLITATFLISNQQTRYAIIYLPMLWIMIVKGFEIMAYNKDRLFKLLMVGAIFVLFTFGVKQINETKASMGIQDYELMDYIKQLPNPKFLLYMHFPKNITSNFYPSPDLFLMETLMVNDNVLKNEQYSKYLYWSTVKTNTDGLMKELNRLGTEIPLYIVCPKERPGLKDFEELMIQNNYTKTDVSWYDIWRRI